jgi:tRNA(Ile)-lysidine synthase
MGPRTVSVTPAGPAPAEPPLAREQRGRAVSDAERVREMVRKEGLLGERGPVVVMVSGGRDSVCLLDVAVALRGSSVNALHLNYRLRVQADADEQHCLELCAQLGIGLKIVRASPREREPGNLQAWARELRYREALRLAAELEDDVQAPVATGHTASDQTETILYRLAASPGRRALLGMAPKDGRVVRPLLGLTREQTAAYCEARGLAWREDASNDSERYARARVRHGLLAALRSVHPAAESNVRRTAALLREETELLDGLVQSELAGRRGIAITRLEELPPALARLVVVRLAEDAAGTFVPQAGDRVQEILALARRGGRAELHVGGRAGAVVEGGVLEMVRLPPRGSGSKERGRSDD